MSGTGSTQAGWVDGIAPVACLRTPTDTLVTFATDRGWFVPTNETPRCYLDRDEAKAAYGSVTELTADEVEAQAVIGDFGAQLAVWVLELDEGVDSSSPVVWVDLAAALARIGDRLDSRIFRLQWRKGALRLVVATGDARLDVPDITAALGELRWVDEVSEPEIKPSLDGSR